MNSISRIFGKSSSAKAADKNQAAALALQQRAANAAIEDGAVARSDPSASGRRIRGLGRRALAFAGSELGVTDTYAGGHA